MADMAYVKRFQDLLVYQVSRELTQEIFEISKNFPKDERYSLTDQIRRSSRSVGAQIAEAWGKRRYERHFISKLTDADAEQLETQHWLLTAKDADYLTREQYVELMKTSIRVGQLIGGMIAKSSGFCGDTAVTISEPKAEYVVDIQSIYLD